MPAFPLYCLFLCLLFLSRRRRRPTVIPAGAVKRLRPCQKRTEGGFFLLPVSVKPQAPIGRWQEKQKCRDTVIGKPVVYLQRGADELRGCKLQVQREQLCFGEQPQHNEKQEQQEQVLKQHVHTGTSFEMFRNLWIYRCFLHLYYLIMRKICQISRNSKPKG